jgi:type II secretion system protein G
MKNFPKRYTKYSILHTGFTLVELLVVMAILGILATIISGGFKNALMRGRDTRRKSDLKQISNALELFYHDWGYYPSALDGKILACPFASDPTDCESLCQPCDWGTTDELTDRRTIYLKKMPKDPYGTQLYTYRVVGSDNKKFQIFTRLENPEDQDCLEGSCFAPTVPTGVTCGVGIRCNYAVTSSNTDAVEE